MTLSAQVVSSNKASIRFNNKLKDQTSQAVSKDQPSGDQQVKQNNAPEIELINIKEEEGNIIHSNESRINLLGRIKSDKKTALFLNNREVKVNESGFFNEDFLLVTGINDISLKAVSEDLLSNEIKIKVEYRPKVVEAAPEADGKYYALLIGINNYSDPLINELNKPIRDAESFYNVITSRYTLNKENIKFLRNATMAEIVDALDYFARIVRPVDNFLIFYAGHGVWDAASNIGFWLPSDANKNSKLAWFRNSTLRDYLLEIKSRHTLIISDACFGGSILRTRSTFLDAPVSINRLYELPSRKAMTSGMYNEEVPDESVFVKYLIDRMQNNLEKYLSAEQLFSKFRMAVINNSKVIPQFGVIQDVGDEGGDFIFILRD
jgi:hypothetical protein